jgi:hypothetical protein
MNMPIIKYDKDGWVCDRYPYNIDNPVGQIEVDVMTFKKTLVTPKYYAWRVVNGELVNERYVETPESEVKENRIRELKKLLADSDYQAIKYAEGRLTEQEYSSIGEQRQAWRDEINRLQG